MKENLLRVPVVCRICRKESLAELPKESVTEALNDGTPIHLSAACHGQAWQASNLEREQLRDYLYAAHLSASERSESV